jgi:hypothetical protein
MTLIQGSDFTTLGQRASLLDIDTDDLDVVERLDVHNQTTASDRSGTKRGEHEEAM